MGRNTFSAAAYRTARTAHVPASGPATQRGHEEVRRTGKLHQLVDPAGFGVIRRSLPRFVEMSNGRFELSVGTPVPIETRLDTTGSMGDNVDRALEVLTRLYDLCSGMLPGLDPQLAIGIFGDCIDRFVLCRPQFEAEAGKIVEQLTLMNPEHGGGGNGGEDPQYGLFGGAYLTRDYLSAIGLKGYDFTISDEPGRDYLDERTLIRVFGPDVFDKLRLNGHGLDPMELPSTKQVVEDLLMRAHAFFLLVDGYHRDRAQRFWTDVFGPSRVVRLPRIELLPQVQAIIIGLTEGILELEGVPSFLAESGASMSEVDMIVRSVAGIPIGAQAALRRHIRMPQQGDVFVAKPDVLAGSDLWPIGHEDAPNLSPPVPPSAIEPGLNWL